MAPMVHNTLHLMIYFIKEFIIYLNGNIDSPDSDLSLASPTNLSNDTFSIGNGDGSCEYYYYYYCYYYCYYYFYYYLHYIYIN